MRPTMALLVMSTALPAVAGPEEEPDSRPTIVACVGGVTGVATSRSRVPACRAHDGAYWFFAAEPRHPRRPYEVTYRFDLPTGVMSPQRVQDAGVPEDVLRAWQELRSAQESGVARLPEHERELHRAGRRYEIEARAIVVQQGLEFRLHPVPWPTWDDVEKWVGEIEWGLPVGQELAHLRELYGERPPGSALGPHAEWDGRLYFGLRGGFSEGEGGFGGLAIFDLAAESWEVLRPALLLEATVTAVTPDPNHSALWLGAVHFGEYGPVPGRGLVRFGLADRSWRAFTAANSEISGDFVWWIRWTPGALWVGTEGGLSRLHLEDLSFENFLWSPVPGDARVPFALRATSPPRPAPPPVSFPFSGEGTPAPGGVVSGTTRGR